MIHGSGFDVKCPSCGGAYHETSHDFDDQLLPLGNMFRLKQKYRQYGWDAFPERDNIRLADLRCPWCDGAYMRGSRIGALVDQMSGETLKQDHPRRKPPSGQIVVDFPAPMLARAEGVTEPPPDKVPSSKKAGKKTHKR